MTCFIFGHVNGLSHLESLMAFSPNGFLNQVLSNGQEPSMRHVNMIAVDLT
jgi:hypothetical protein